MYNRKGIWQGNVLKTYVINLERSKDRRAFQEKQLEAHGLEHEFVPAIDGQLLGPEHHVDDLSPGIVGCAMSHREAYRQALEDGQAAALVVEDDAILPPHTNRLLDAIGPELSGAEAALLHYRAYKPCPLTKDRGTSLGDGFELLYPISPEPLSAATAYVITAEACERMVDFMAPIRLWPDDWKAYLRGGALDRVRCVAPRPVEAQTRLKSTVGYADGPMARVIPAPIRAWRRERIQRSYSEFPLVTEPAQPQGAR